jgi:hypothetical protein
MYTMNLLINRMKMEGNPKYEDHHIFFYHQGIFHEIHKIKMTHHVKINGYDNPGY